MAAGILVWMALGILMAISLGRRRGRSSKWLASGLGIAGAVVIGVVAIRLVVISQEEFSDRCIEWGVRPNSYNGVLMSTNPRSTDPCANRREETGRTRKQEAIRMLRFGDGGLLASWLGLSGILWRRRARTLAGAALIFILVPRLVMSIIMPVAWITGIALLAKTLQLSSGAIRIPRGV